MTVQPFDPDRGELSGSPFPAPEATKISLGARFYYSGLSAANNGMLLLDNAPDRYRLTWFGRDGQVLGTISEVDRYTAVRIAPDGTRALVISFSNVSTNARDLWTRRLCPRDQEPFVEPQRGNHWDMIAGRQAHHILPGSGHPDLGT